MQRKMFFAAIVASLVCGLVLGRMTSDGSEARKRLQALESRLEELESASAKPSGGAAPSARATPRPLRPNQVVSLEGLPTRGPADASVTIVEFVDFASPYCARSAETLARLQDDFPEDVRLIFRHMPGTGNADAELAHRAAAAAGLQGRFWEMHDRIFNNPRDLGRGMLLEHVRALKLDVVRFRQDLGSESTEELVERDRAAAIRRGVTTVPTFVVNGHVVTGAQPYSNLKVVIERARSHGG